MSENVPFFQNMHSKFSTSANIISSKLELFTNKHIILCWFQVHWNGRKRRSKKCYGQNSKEKSAKSEKLIIFSGKSFKAHFKKFTISMEFYVFYTHTNFWGHISTFCKFWMQMLLKRNIFRHLLKTKNLKVLPNLNPLEIPMKV